MVRIYDDFDRNVSVKQWIVKRKKNTRISFDWTTIKITRIG